METEHLRTTHIAGGGDLPWGTHFCHFFREQADINEAVIPYLKAGLGNNELCLWVCSKGAATRRRAALSQAIPEITERFTAGDIEIRPVPPWSKPCGTVEAGQVIEDWKATLDMALSKGYQGLRVVVDGSWLLGKQRSVLSGFENTIDQVIAGQRMMVLCAYPLKRLDSSLLLDILHNHSLVSGAWNGRYEMVKTPPQRESTGDGWTHLRFFQNLDRVNRAIQGTNDLDGMLSEVLEALLDMFDCDRAWLVYPCDPETESWRVPMEKTRPEYPGALELGVEVPIDADAIKVFQAAIQSDGPVQFGPGAKHPLPRGEIEQFGLKSQIAMALRPKGDRPWLFGLHRCSRARTWTVEEERLFQEIGRRLTDALTSLLACRDVRESEAKYRRIVDTAVEGILVLGEDTRITFVNAKLAEMVGVQIEDMVGQPLTAFLFEEDMSDHLERMEERRRGLSSSYERRLRRKDGSEVWTLASAVPIMDSSGNFKGSFGMFTDITERKLVVQRLQDHLNELQRWHDLTLNREERVQELKREVNLLLDRLGEPHRYGSQCP